MHRDSRQMGNSTYPMRARHRFDQLFDSSKRWTANKEGVGAAHSLYLNCGRSDIVLACPGFIFRLGLVEDGGGGCCFRALSASAERRFWVGSFVDGFKDRESMCVRNTRESWWTVCAPSHIIICHFPPTQHRQRPASNINGANCIAVMTRMISMIEVHFFRTFLDHAKYDQMKTALRTAGIK